VGRELGKSLEEVAEMSMPELEIWIAYFQYVAEQEKQAYGRANNHLKSRHP